MRLVQNCNVPKVCRVLLSHYPLEYLHNYCTTMAKPVETLIRTKLSKMLDIKHLDVINESYMHNVPKGSETHFKVVVVSEKFDGLPLIKRHRIVNNILKEELNSGVHALSIVAHTPSQWDSINQKVESSPKCMGGFGK